DAHASLLLARHTRRSLRSAGRGRRSRPMLPTRGSTSTSTASAPTQYGRCCSDSQPLFRGSPLPNRGGVASAGEPNHAAKKQEAAKKRRIQDVIHRLLYGLPTEEY